MDRTAVTQLLVDTLNDFGLPPGTKEELPFSETTILFGPGGIFDSVSLVAFILDVEDAVRDRYGVSITLADDRAMSQTRSPFRRVSNLADYATQLITEQQAKS